MEKMTGKTVQPSEKAVDKLYRQVYPIDDMKIQYCAISLIQSGGGT